MHRPAEFLFTFRLLLFSFFSLFSFFFFCIYYEFIFAEYLCAHFPLLLIALSFSGGCLVTEFFSLPFLILIFALDAKVSKCISESFGRSGYVPCRIGKDGGFIRRDRSFHLPMINLAKDGQCVTDTFSKKFMYVWVSTG